MIEQEILRKIIVEINKMFSPVEAIILYGSALTDDYVSGSSDVDILIVVDQDYDEKWAMKSLVSLKGDLKDDVDLDPILCNRDELANERVVSVNGTRVLHELDAYLLKSKSNVVFGDNTVLNRVPHYSLEQVLKKILPYIQKHFVLKLKKDLVNVEPNKLIKQNENIFYVLVRTIYTIDNFDIVSKMKAVNYLSEEYTEHKSISIFLKNVYLKEKIETKIENDDMKIFFDLVSNKINEFLGTL